MTKRSGSKLSLRRETLRPLDPQDLTKVAGGSSSILDWERTAGTNFIVAPRPTR